MQVVLVMFSADGARRNFPITREMTIIGRREDCDLRIPLGEVSRKHCRIITDPDGSVRVEDLGSSNGTYVNSQRVQEAALNPGDTVRVGPVAFVLQVDGVPSDDQIAPDANAATDAPTLDDSDIPAAPTPRKKSPRTPTPATDENGEFDPMSALEDDEKIDSGFELDLSDELNNSGSKIDVDKES